MAKNAKLKEKQKWSHEKLHLDNARKLRGIFSLTLRTRNSRRPSGKLARNWKHQWLLLCFAKLIRTIRIAGLVHPTKIKTKLACILEASESTRLRMGESLPAHYEDHIAGRGDNSLQHYNQVHKLIPMPEAMKIPEAKAAVDKEWEKWRNFRRGTWRKSDVRKRWSMKQGRRAQKFISPHWWTSVIWKMLNWRQNT